jgi:hypothetical protein
MIETQTNCESMMNKQGGIPSDSIAMLAMHNNPSSVTVCIDTPTSSLCVLPDDARTPAGWELSPSSSSSLHLLQRLRGGGKVGGRDGRSSGRSQRQHKPYKTPRDRDDPMSSESRGVFCGNLSYETTWQSLKDHMRQAGEVTRADILTDRATGRSKGCGVVEYEDAADARKALRDLHDTELDGRQIILREDREEGNPAAAAHSNSNAGPSSFDRPLSAPRSAAPPQSRRRVYVGNLSWGKSFCGCFHPMIHPQPPVHTWSLLLWRWLHTRGFCCDTVGFLILSHTHGQSFPISYIKPLFVYIHNNYRCCLARPQGLYAKSRRCRPCGSHVGTRRQVEGVRYL